MSDEQLLGGRYRLARLLGRGGMAEVYEARDEVLDRHVAVKLLLSRFRNDPEFIGRFRREAQAAASLSHPNIVAVYDTGQHDRLPYIVMELVRGQSLEEAIDQGGLTEDQALEICAEVCSALEYAHGRGLVHRDIKPGNILLASGGQVKVTDFGIARAVTAETITQTASVLGTAAYLSPEQAQGRPVDVRSDLYSLGVVLYEMLTGRKPFEGDSAVGVAYQHVQEAPVPPRQVGAGISPAAEAIAMKAMAKNVANRYQSAAAMRTDLLHARAGESVHAPAVLRAEETAILDAAASGNRPPRPPRATRRRRAAVYALLGVLSVAAAAAAVVYVATLLAGDEVPAVTVPSVTGMTVSQAQALLDQHGLASRVRDSVFSDTVAPNHVVRQEPAAGQRATQDTLVRLDLSAGREQVTVPAEVVGNPEEEALQTLRDARLVPGERTTEFSNEHPEGVVMSTTPAPGTSVPVRSQVAYVVSAGEELVRVRPVEGQPEAEARFDLESQGFEVLVVREFSERILEGFVIEQDPDPGTELEKGAEVTIVVSRGPQEQPSPTPTRSRPSPSPSPSPTGPEPSPSG